jgi:hypothetical protein
VYLPASNREGEEEEMALQTQFNIQLYQINEIKND